MAVILEVIWPCSRRSHKQTLRERQFLSDKRHAGTMTLACGVRVGPFEIQSALGAGGMGEVYRARDTRLGRTVAINVLTAAVESHAVRRLRFDQEARAVSSLTHPHICALYDIG